MLSTYLKYASVLNLKSELVHQEHGCVIIKITGKNVWEAFKNEPGKHVVQRVPPTEKNGRRQTSVITVVVVPLPPENSQQSLQDKDLEVIYQTGKQGAGGQNVNRVKSAVRMKHKPTGLSVFINGRDQGSNYREALRILTYRVNEFRKNAQNDSYRNLRKNQMMNCGDVLGGRGNKVRTYNFVRNEIIDHNLQRKTNNIKDFMKGDFSLLFAGERC